MYQQLASEEDGLEPTTGSRKRMWLRIVFITLADLLILYQLLVIAEQSHYPEKDVNDGMPWAPEVERISKVQNGDNELPDQIIQETKSPYPQIDFTAGLSPEVERISKEVQTGDNDLRDRIIQETKSPYPERSLIDGLSSAPEVERISKEVRNGDNELRDQIIPEIQETTSPYIPEKDLNDGLSSAPEVERISKEVQNEDNELRNQIIPEIQEAKSAYPENDFTDGLSSAPEVERISKEEQNADNELRNQIIPEIQEAKSAYPERSLIDGLPWAPEVEVQTWDDELRDQIIQELQEHKSVKSRSVFVGDEPILSQILPSGQLVVPVNRTYAMWYRGAEKLCKLLRRMILTENLAKSFPLPSPVTLPPPILNMTFDCEDINRPGVDGQGNWITAIYVSRLAAAYAKVEFHFQTKQEDEFWYQSSLLPWFKVIQPAPSSDNPWPFDGQPPRGESEMCSHYKWVRVDKMSHAIQGDLRAMAWQIVAPPAHLATSSPPPIPFPSSVARIPNVTLDDVALHFRCGDIMGVAKENYYGIIKYAEYLKWIDAKTTSIGILTQPFGKELLRAQDSTTTDACRTAVYLLVDYLQAHYPNATISIRNSREETLPLTYARMVMAKQAFTSLSSFGIFPVVGTYGEGYFQRGNHGCNNFATNIPKVLSNIHEMVSPILGSNDIRTIGINATFAWLVTETNDAVPIPTAVPVPDPEPTVLFWDKALRDQIIQELQEHKAVKPRSVYVGEESILSEILPNGQLVVPVDRKHAMSDKGAKKLCNLLQRMILADSLSKSSQLPSTSPLPPPILNMTFDFKRIKSRGADDQGNWLIAIYAARLAAAYAKIEFQFQTKQQDESSYMSYLLPWFKVIQPAPTSDNPWPFDGEYPRREKELCFHYKWTRLDKVSNVIRNDLRAMAWQLVSPPAHVVTSTPPTIPFPSPVSRIPNVNLDDVVLYCQCDEIVDANDKNNHGLTKYSEYLRWIDPNTTSIGILTQPFGKDLNSCRGAVYSLVDYLQVQYPNATISVRKGPEETLPLTYARIVMAKQAFTSPNSFGIFPIMGTYGEGYFEQGLSFLSTVTQYLPNVHAMIAPKIDREMVKR